MSLWQIWLELTVNALVLASLLGMLTVGLTLIFGIMRIMNFAHGALYMFGAYVGITAAYSSNNFWIGLILAPLSATLIGAIFEFFLLRRLYGRDPSSFLLVTFGLSLVLTEGTRQIWGSNTRDVLLPDFLNGVVSILDEPFPVYRLFLIAFGLVALALLAFVILKSRLGLLVRSIAQNADMTNALGINVGTIRTMTFAVGCGFAGLGGYLAVPLVTGYIGMGSTAIIDSFVIVMIGGMGSFVGSAVGSLLVAGTQTIGNFYFPDLALAVTYILMIGVLLVRPGGLFGEAE